MINTLLWIVVVFGYGLAVFEIVKVLVFSYTLFSDVPYVPSNKEIAEYAIKELDLQDGDSFIDIGSGDGKVVFLAAKKTDADVSFSGLEIRGFLTFLSNIKKILFLNKKITFINSNAFNQNYAKFNKVFLYMTTDITEKLMYKLEKELPVGAMVISCVFSPGKFVQTHKVEKKEVKIRKKQYNLYLWIKK